MAALVVDFVSVSSEGPSAVFAQVRFLACVRPYVMAQTCALRKSTRALWVSARIWLDPQMYISVPRQRGLRVEGLKTAGEETLVATWDFGSRSDKRHRFIAFGLTILLFYYMLTFDRLQH